MKKFLAVFLCCGMLLVPVLSDPGLFAIEMMAVTTKIIHEPITYFVSGSRIIVQSGVTDSENVKLVRCYFRAKGEANYVFVDMDSEENDQYRGVLPAPGQNTAVVEYIILVVNESNVVVRTPVMEMSQDASGPRPEWQNDDSREKLVVKTELPSQTMTVNGFSDSISIDLVESLARFGYVADGIYIFSQMAGESGPVAAASGGIVSPERPDDANMKTEVVDNSATVNKVTKRRGIRLWAIILAAVVTVGIGVGVYFLFIKKKNKDSDLPGGTGEVKVTLQWYNCADLDLWVYDPCGKRIYYLSTTSTCQGKYGQLDIDSNAACYSKNCSDPAENIYWVTAPSGTYTVKVNYYMSCSGSGSTSYKVTTIVKGRRSTYTGSLSNHETDTVTTFTR